MSNEGKKSVDGFGQSHLQAYNNFARRICNASGSFNVLISIQRVGSSCMLSKERSICCNWALINLYKGTRMTPTRTLPQEAYREARISCAKGSVRWAFWREHLIPMIQGEN